MLTQQMPQSEVVIACDPSALTAEQQERWMEVGPKVYQAIEEIQELADGYAFRLPNSPEMLLLLAEDLNFERLCCPFIHYAVEIESNRGPFWLRMTGGDGVKVFLQMNFEATNLIDEQVAKAAGFSVSARMDIDSVETALETTYLVNERFARSAGSTVPDQNVSAANGREQ
jgi:hypothetical protein